MGKWNRNDVEKYCDSCGLLEGDCVCAEDGDDDYFAANDVDGEDGVDIKDMFANMSDEEIEEELQDRADKRSRGE